MGQPQHLEATGEALAQAALDEEGGGAQQDDLQRPARPGVGVPQALDRLGPARHLLHLVEHEERAVVGRLVGEAPRRFPLLLDPRRAPEGRLVRAGVAGRQAALLRRLVDQGGLADLARAGHDLQEVARLPKPFDELVDLRSGVSSSNYSICRVSLLTTLSKARPRVLAGHPATGTRPPRPPRPRRRSRSRAPPRPALRERAIDVRPFGVDVLSPPAAGRGTRAPRRAPWRRRGRRRR